MKALISLLTVIILLNSCKKTITGVDISIYPVFIGYNDSEIDTFTIRRFSAGNNFQTLVDSSILTSRSENYYKFATDSVIVSFSTVEGSIRPGLDYKIFIPATNQVFSISEIKNEKITCRVKTGYMERREGCGNPNLSYTVNNQTLVAQTLPISASVVYFKR